MKDAFTESATAVHEIKTVVALKAEHDQAFPYLLSWALLAI